MEQKRLCKSRRNKMICGVCGGVAEYLNLDPTLVRLVFLLISFAFGMGIIFYLLAAVVMPQE